MRTSLSSMTKTPNERRFQGLEPFEHMLFVDTLHIFKAVGSEYTGGCNKLQCNVTRHRAVDGRLQAHRALDDCFALRGVLLSISGLLGVSVALLLRPFTAALDKDATLVQLSCLV